MKVFIHDGLRHTRLSGYGMLSRNLMLGLSDLGHVVARQAQASHWENIEPGVQKRLESLPVMKVAEADIVLQIGTPGACRAFDKPSLIYTQNALGDLRPEWVESLASADGYIVPGEF